MSSEDRSQSKWIQRVEVEGLYGARDLEIDFRPGLNVVHGRNGSGKTTLLHVLANFTGADLARFCFLRFQSISLQMSTGSRVGLTRGLRAEQTPVQLWIDGRSAGEIVPGRQTPDSLRLLVREHVGGKPVYLPAFRAVLEAASRAPPRSSFETDKELIHALEREIEEEEVRQGAAHSDPDFVDRIAQKTLMCRDWFGMFVPIIRTPSLLEIVRSLDQELQYATWIVALQDREALASVFVNAFEAMVRGEHSTQSGSVDSVLGNLRELLSRFVGEEKPGRPDAEGVYRKLATLAHELSAGAGVPYGVLRVYEAALRARLAAQEHAYRRVNTFIESVNRFLEQKRLNLDLFQSTERRAFGGVRNRPLVVTSDEQRHPISILSSGERQVVTLLFAATHMSPMDGVLLLDEPELSLHVDWQRIVLAEMLKQSGSRQIIACTHAPEVAADHQDCIVRLIEGGMPSASA